MADPATGRPVDVYTLFTVWSLPEAIAMVTRDAARPLGMVDRGVIRTGMRADLALVVRTDGVAEATLVMRGGEIVQAARAGLMGMPLVTALAARNGHATTFAERTVPSRSLTPASRGIRQR